MTRQLFMSQSHSARATGQLVCVSLLVTFPTLPAGAGPPREGVASRRPQPASAEAILSKLTPAGASAQRPRLVMSHDGLSGIALCSRLDTVNAVFHEVKDTIFEAELSSRWPGKVVPYGHGRITFESSSSDSIRIWRISTTSPDVRTGKGYHVGITLRDLTAAGEHPRVELPEGRVLILLQSDGIGVAIDTASEVEFYNHYDFKRPPRIESVNPDARVMEMTTGADCSTKRER